MLAAQADGIEALLNRLLRSHRERAGLATRMAERKHQRGGLVRELEERARAYEESAAVIARLLGLRKEDRP